MVVKTYTNIWKVERVFYNISDLQLPRPVSVSMVFWIFIFFLLSLFLKGFPPFLFPDSILMNHVAIPIFLAWFIDKKTFDGKKPYTFLKSAVSFFVSSKTWTKGRPINLQCQTYRTEITIGALYRDLPIKKRKTGRKNNK